MDFTILNWNIGGAKYLELKEDERNKFWDVLNKELKGLVHKHTPHVFTLQEIVRYGTSSQDAEDIVDRIEGYRYYSFTLIDTDRLSSKAKWNKVKRAGGWGQDSYFAQGNAMLLRDDILHSPVWALPARLHNFTKTRHFIEQVNLESGLYFGDRDTEPRSALVTHLVFNPKSPNEDPLDIFVVNLHLTTLMMEREGVPEVDMKASRIRMGQLDVIFSGIVSRYNIWKQQGFPERGEHRQPESGETFKRHQPVWILAGDFNFTPESMEYETIKKMNFIDVHPNKGTGTKAKGKGKLATLTVDYIFAGPKFISLDPLITDHAILRNGPPDYSVKVSDHYPLFATIPLAIVASED